VRGGVVIRLLSLASDGKPFERKPFVRDGDVNYLPPGETLKDKCGVIYPTFDIDEALVFSTFTDAARWMKTQSTLLPIRPDGQPNRPFMAYNVEFLIRSILHSAAHYGVKVV
jgi:hypothetical protein